MSITAFVALILTIQAILSVVGGWSLVVRFHQPYQQHALAQVLNVLAAFGVAVVVVFGLVITGGMIGITLGLIGG